MRKLVFLVDCAVKNAERDGRTGFEGDGRGYGSGYYDGGGQGYGVSAIGHGCGWGFADGGGPGDGWGGYQGQYGTFEVTDK